MIISNNQLTLNCTTTLYQHSHTPSRGCIPWYLSFLTLPRLQTLHSIPYLRYLGYLPLAFTVVPTVEPELKVTPLCTWSALINYQSFTNGVHPMCISSALYVTLSSVSSVPTHTVLYLTITYSFLPYHPLYLPHPTRHIPSYPLHQWPYFSFIPYFTLIYPTILKLGRINPADETTQDRNDSPNQSAPKIRPNDPDRNDPRPKRPVCILWYGLTKLFRRLISFVSLPHRPSHHVQQRA